MNWKSIKKQYDKQNIGIKVGLWYTFCNVLQRGVSVITVPVFTRVLTKEQYGTYSLYLSWLNILSIFTCLNLYYGVFNKAMIKYEDDRDRYISSMQGLTISLCLGCFIVYLFFRESFNSFFGLPTVIMFMMFVEMMVVPSLQFWSGRQRFEYRYKGLVWVSVIKTILNPALGIVAVLLTEYKTEARILSAVIIELVICVPLMVQQFVKGKAFFVKEYWKYSVRFNIPLLPHYLSGSLLNQGDRVVIQKICTVSDVALYSVAHNVAMLTQLVTNAIAQAVTPWLYGCLKEKNYKDINKRLDFLMVLVGTGCILLMLFAPEIVRIFASEEYSSAVYVIPPIAASVFFIYVYNIYSNFEFYFEKRLFISIASVLAAVLNVILNVIFVSLFGYVAAGYTTLVCYILYAFMHYFFSDNVCVKQLNGIHIFRPRTLIIMTLFMVFACIIISFLYKFFAIRYLLIMISFLFIYMKRKGILEVIQGVRGK